jgi:pectate lyase
MKLINSSRGIGRYALFTAVTTLLSCAVQAQTLGSNLTQTGPSAGADGSGFSDTKLVRDADTATFTEASGTSNQRVSVKWGSAVDFNTVILRESGSKVGAWQLVNNDTGEVLASGTGIGAARTVNLGNVSMKKLNLIVSGSSPLRMAEIEVYNATAASSVAASSTPASSTPASSAAASSTPATQTIVYQAEGGSLSQAAVESNHAGYNGSGFVNFDNLVGSSAQWTVNQTSAGNATLNFRFANGTSSSRAMSISVNGTVINSALAFNGTGAWDSWADQSLSVYLNAGNNVIRAVSAGADGGPNLDQLAVTSTLVAASSSAPASSAAPSSIPASSTPASSSSVATSSAPSSYNGAIRPAKMEGFAAHAGVTGGQGGAVVTVSTGTELNAALCNRASMTTPIIIKVNGTINHGNTTSQGCNTQGDLIEIKQMSNVSIIGVGTNALFDELGIHVRDASNIIIQNVHIRNVKKSGSPTSNGGDAIGMESSVDRVWIDHNWLEASGGEKDGYDSLLDMKAGVTNVTVSYNLYNDSSRAGLIGSSDSDNKNTNITFHHNWYKNIEQRTPLIRHALVHMYNNYWSNDRIDYMFHAINSRSNGKVLVESNYMYNVNNPLIASDDSPTPGCWQTNNDNTVLPEIYYSRTVGDGALVVPEVINGQLQSTCSVSVPYSVQMDAANDIPAIVMANVGVGKVDGTSLPTSSSAAASSKPASSVAPSSLAASSIAPSSSSVASSTVSSQSSSSASSVVIVDNGTVSAACLNLVANPSVNWRESALQSDQEIVACLSQTLGRAVGYGENALGGYDPNGNSHLVVIRKNTGVLPEQQVLDAISSEAHNWIVFDKNDYANGGDLAMYRLSCSNAGVLAALDNATQAECLDHNLWCANHGVNSASCAATFFNDRLNDKSLIIRNELVKSNTTIDGRGTQSRFLFNGFKIGADDSGVSTYQAQNVILTHLQFEGAGHAEDHYLDPDMIRSTGESHDIWIHKNTFKNTGDSAFDVKVGAYGITISYNRLVDVLRSSLHGSSDSRTINSQIRTTLHNNFFVTTDEFFSGPHAADNTARRVPLLRRGSAHMFNNVFYNYRKNFGSVRVGGTLFMENNVFLGGPVIQDEKGSLAASFDEWLTYLTKDDFDGGYFGSSDGLVTFSDTNCRIDSSYQGFLPAVIGGSPRDLKNEYSQTSRTAISSKGFSAGQDLVDYTNATAGKYGEEPFNSPMAKTRAAIISAGQAGCL